MVHEQLLLSVSHSNPAGGKCWCSQAPPFRVIHTHWKLYSLKFHKMCQTHRSEDTVLFMRWHGQITPILKLQHLFFSIWQAKKHLFYSPWLCSAPLWPAVIHTCRHWRDGNAHMELLCLKLVTVSRETYFCWGENEDRQKNPGEKQHWKTQDLHIWRIIIYTITPSQTKTVITT